MTFGDYVGSHRERLLFDAYQRAGTVPRCMVVATVVGGSIGVAARRREWATGLTTATASAVLRPPRPSFCRLCR